MYIYTKSLLVFHTSASALVKRALSFSEEGRRKKKGDGRQEKGDKKWKRRNRRRKA